MRWWRTLIGKGETREERLRRIAECRWVVLDVETTGLDQANDTMLAIGAVAVRDGRIDVDDSFERIVRPPQASGRQNILVHGIGAQAQRDGTAPEQACEAFLDWAGPSPLVGFHAGFDRAFLTRSVRYYLGLTLTRDWLDLAGLAPALNPGVRAKALDEWLAHFDLQATQRHHACADAFATAMLFLRLMAQVPQNQRDYAGLQRLARAGRWVGQ